MNGALVALAALAGPVDTLRDAVVVVRQAGGTCAGVVLEDGRVGTAYHCVAGGFGARIERRDGTRGRARVVATDPRHDLAVLDVVPHLDGGLALGPAPEVGDTVTIVGHPYASGPPAGFLAGTLQWSVGTGTIAAVGERSLQVDGTVAPGHSGGPVVDSAGRVVGVLSRRLGDRIGFAGRAEALTALRDTPRRPALGGTVAVSPAAWITRRPAVGLDLEVTWRERLVVGVRGGLPVAPFVRALAGEATEATVGLARAGGRLPIGHGAGSVQVEAFAGVGLARVWTPDQGVPVVTTRGDVLVGGAVGRSGFHVEVARRLGPADGAEWLLGLRLGLGALRRVW